MKSTVLPMLWLIGAMTSAARGEWLRTEHSIAWREGSNIVWRFSFDPGKGKTFFDPVACRGTTFTNFKPEDHPWHYGLWFSWKFINQVNYWEENRQTGKAEGTTRWDKPAIKTKADGSASIRLNVAYAHPSGRVDIAESRVLNISAPAADGSYSIDWQANFTAGPEGAVLDRTPMPNEPDGKVNGGYAGLGLRAAGPPLGFSVMCSTGAVSRFESDRARPNAPAVACNFTDGARDVGGIAIFSDPISAGANPPWYIANTKEMRFACAAILAPKVLTLKAGEKMELRYRIAVSPKAWSVESLRAQQLK